MTLWKGSSSRPSVGVVGAGRLGTSLARALRAARLEVDGPVGRGEEGAEAFEGAGCAIAGTHPDALAVAEDMALALGMKPFEIDDRGRAAYHAAASVASNFLVTLEGAAERLAATAGVDRALLAPLVRAAVENWAARGAEDALTGPIARGDEETVARQRAAVEKRTPDLLPLFDAMVDATRAVVA